MRFEAYSTQLIRYYIPSKIGNKANQARTDHAIINVNPEKNFTKLDMYLSLDMNFDLLQDKPAVQIVDDGITIKFAK